MNLRDALSEADRVVFLGFAFHEDNVRKLKLPASFRVQPQPQIFMSAFGITEQEVGHLKGKYGMPPVTHGREDADVARFLATYPQILDHY